MIPVSRLSNPTSQILVVCLSSWLSSAHSSALVFLTKNILRCVPNFEVLFGCVCLEFWFLNQ